MPLHANLTRPLPPPAARWLRWGLRCLGLISWLLVMFFCYVALISSCRSTPALPTTTAVPVPTFTPTPAPLPTATNPLSTQAIAYVSNGQLYLGEYPALVASPIDRCPTESSCFSDLGWSPQGNRLLYLKSTDSADSKQSAIYWVDAQDRIPHLVATANDRLALSMPVWSPDGQRIAYGQGTDEALSFFPSQAQVDNGQWSDSLRERVELWVIAAPFADGGQKAGDIYRATGCGGYPATESDSFYTQAGTAISNGGSVQMRLLWLADDHLLFSRACAGGGIGAFDLISGQEVTPLDKDTFFVLAVHAQRQHWAGSNRSSEIMVGTASGEIITTSIAALLLITANSRTAENRSIDSLFWGATSGRLYFTERSLTESIAVKQERYATSFGLLPQSFAFFQTTLFVADANAIDNAQARFSGDDFGYANLTETANGDLLFVRIPNERALVQAIQTGVTSAQLAEQEPRPQIVRLVAGAAEPDVLLDNAGQLTLALPQPAK